MRKILLSMIIALTLNAAYADYDKGLAAFHNKDYATAFKEFKESADKDDINAQYSLGLMYDNGYGVPKNTQEAAKWYLLAANQGDANAQVNLGALYYIGSGVPMNAQKAVKWYSLAVKQGNTDAQYNLGMIYAYGDDGVPENTVLAYALYSLVANKGDNQAKETRNALGLDLTPDQLAEAQKIINTWKIGTPFPTKTKY